MGIQTIELSSVLFIQYELQKLKFNFRGSIILVSNVSREKKNNPNDKGCKGKTSHREKLS